MSSNDPPPPPDYTPIANASAEAARLNAQIAQEQLDWAKKTYADNKGVTDRVVDSFLEAQDTNQANANKDRARYEELYQPLEDSLVQDAQSYASPDRKDLEMGRAQSNVAQQFDAARINAQRELESFGINPGATRYAALDIGARTQQAAAAAAAGNQASQQVDATGRALRSEAINVGRGYPGQIAGQFSTANQSGSGAVNNNLATTASGASTMGTPTQYGALSNNNLATWGNTLNQGYQNAVSAYNAQQSANSGVGSALGLAAGLFFEDGGAVPTDGGAVPEQVSPSRGKAIDDVPARVSVGEFIIPKKAVDWYGEKHFYSLIAKADADRAEAKKETGAVPTVHPGAMGVPMSPRVRSRALEV